MTTAVYTVFGLQCDSSGYRMVAAVLEGDHTGSVREWDGEDAYSADSEQAADIFRGEADGNE
ncbi:hypothetical protein AB0A98_06075 [Streptomyces chrestomyceticus]|uniref:hypothetical protein n=1 Tax=Streptomyces chrestomyceticus TaxID=68185 RepID=UPI0033E5E4AD